MPRFSRAKQMIQECKLKKYHWRARDKTKARSHLTYHGPYIKGTKCEKGEAGRVTCTFFYWRLKGLHPGRKKHYIHAQTGCNKRMSLNWYRDHWAHKVLEKMRMDQRYDGQKKTTLCIPPREQISICSYRHTKKKTELNNQTIMKTKEKLNAWYKYRWTSHINATTSTNGPPKDRLI